MLRTVLAVFCLAAVALVANAAEAVFKPCLEQVVVNGKTLYKAGEKAGESLEIDSSWPAKIEYVFRNNGTKSADKPLVVFVHFSHDGEIALAGDFYPSPVATEWAPGKTLRFTRSVNLAGLKGRDVTVFVGMYDTKGKNKPRFPLDNKGIDRDLRLPVGMLKIR